MLRVYQYTDRFVILSKSLFSFLVLLVQHNGALAAPRIAPAHNVNDTSISLAPLLRSLWDLGEDPLPSASEFSGEASSMWSEVLRHRIPAPRHTPIPLPSVCERELNDEDSPGFMFYFANVRDEIITRRRPRPGPGHDAKSKTSVQQAGPPSKEDEEDDPLSNEMKTHFLLTLVYHVRRGFDLEEAALGEGRFQIESPRGGRRPLPSWWPENCRILAYAVARLLEEELWLLAYVTTGANLETRHSQLGKSVICCNYKVKRLSC